MSNQRDTFGAELRRSRLAAGLSLGELADRIHYTKGYLSKVETGAAPPNQPLAVLCDAELGTEGRLRALAAEYDGRPRKRPNTTVPRSGLPPVTTHFTGRADEFDRVRAALLAGTDPLPRICVIDGMAGVGKTTLAVRIAHRVEARFTDGCLFLDLHGYTQHATEVSTQDALGRLLSRLGVPADLLPADEDERAALYRDQLRGKRILIVLDNAHSARQVVPLLPAEPKCRVLVTSRNRLTALDDAHHISLETLRTDEAAELFRSVAAARFPGARPGANDDLLVDRIVEACGRLPLAVRIAAARYQGNPAWSLADLYARLADEAARLSALDDGERSVTATFRLSYLGLPDDQRRMFGLLALHPGSDVDVPAAAALADTEPATAERLLYRLREAHLLIEQVADRYQFHDLLRVFAAESVTVDIPDADRRAAVHRLLDHAVHGADLASRLLAPHRRRPAFVVDRLPARTSRSMSFADRDAALAWLDTEWPTLVALCRLAAEQGPPDRCWQLAFALRDFFFLTKLRDQWIETHLLAVEAARAAGARPAQATMLNNLGIPYLDRGDLDTAATCYAEALALFRELGDGPGISTALANQAWVSHYRGDHHDALRDLHQALDFYRRERLRRNVAITLRGISLIEAESGAFTEAVRHANEALATAGELGLDLDAAMTLNCLGWAHYRAGRHDEADAYYRRAMALGRRIGSRHESARAETGLGNLAAAAGNWARARQYWARAREHCPDLNPAVVAETRACLGQLDEESRQRRLTSA